MKLYHGSRTLFERPQNQYFQTGMGSSERGYGFNTSDYKGTAWEHANGLAGGPGVIYEYDLDDSRLSHWFVQGQEIGQTLYDRITSEREALSKYTSNSFWESFSPESDGYETMMRLGADTQRSAKIFAKCGIEGGFSGGCAIFFDSRFVPDQKIDSVLGDFPAAHAALEAQKHSGRLSVDQPVKADGCPVGPRKTYHSEEFASAALRMYETKNAELIATFETLATKLLDAENSPLTQSDRYSMRNNYGLAIQRSFLQKPNTLSNEWSGASTFERTNNWAQTVAHSDGIIETAHKLQQQITHITHRSFPQDTPRQDRTKTPMQPSKHLLSAH